VNNERFRCVEHYFQPYDLLVEKELRSQYNKTKQDIRKYSPLLISQPAT